jgi:hypothetical protein
MNKSPYGLFPHGCTMEGGEVGEDSKCKVGQELKILRGIEVRSGNGKRNQSTPHHTTV